MEGHEELSVNDVPPQNFAYLSLLPEPVDPVSSVVVVSVDCKVIPKLRLSVFVPMEKGCDSP